MNCLPCSLHWRRQFIKEGYSVIYLHRANCARPFARSVRALSDNLLENLSLDEDEQLRLNAGALTTSVKSALQEHQQARKRNGLLLLPFTSISEYLFLLRAVAVSLKPLARRAMLYLAAAVSDFYIPDRLMATHKIQSSIGSLDLHLNGVCSPVDLQTCD